MRTIKVGTRRSELAMTQTKQVIADLEQAGKRIGKNVQFEIVEIVTKGDVILDVTLSKVGGKGLFVKEIEQALLSGAIDMAVHSMKDMPSSLQPGLINGAVPRREDPRDCLVSKHEGGLAGLPKGALIGTSSLRRTCQLLHYRPDLKVKFVRGNIGTRINKLETEGFDGVILAAAGLKRVGWEARINELIDQDISLPAVGQGALGIECRQDDRDLLELLAEINDEETALTVAAERAFLARMDGSCQVPIGAFAELESAGGSQQIRMTGMVGSPDGTKMLKTALTGSDPDELGAKLAQSLRAQGADELLALARNEQDTL